ncbi:MAG: F0F1 ATP synthase subunit B [Bacteroidota bacterium]
MDLVKPAIGLIFWMTLSFGIVLFILGKFAWKPILKALKDREGSIQDALDTAKKTKLEMAALKADNEKLLNQARAERDLMLKEARDTKDAIIAEAKTKATAEANKLLKSAREAINTEKNAAISELKSQVAKLSVEVAEKILRHELANDDKQKQLMENLLKDVNLN